PLRNPAGPGNHLWYAQQLFIQERTLEGQPMRAQGVAMIGRVYRDRRSRLLERLQHNPETRIGVLDQLVIKTTITPPVFRPVVEGRPSVVLVQVKQLRPGPRLEVPHAARRRSDTGADLGPRAARELINVVRVDDRNDGQPRPSSLLADPRRRFRRDSPVAARR